METIRDAKGRIVCKLNPICGMVEIKYLHLKVTMTVPIGKSFTVDRDGILTTVVRNTETHFMVL